MGHIVWIASYPKSGNTWVRAFLHEILRPDDGAFDLDRMAQTAGNEASIDNYRIIDPRPWGQWTPGEVARARPAAQAAFARRHGRVVFCKTHLAVLRSRGRPTINMDVTAGAIYIVRNPLDIALSYADHQGVPLDVAISLMNLENHETPSTASHVSELLGSWSQNVETWTRRSLPGLHVMRYEDMLATPVAAFSGLAAFLKLKMGRRRIKEAVRATSFGNLRHLEDEKGFGERSAPQRRFFRQGRAGTWRTALSASQVTKIASCNEAMMRKFDYWKDVEA